MNTDELISRKLITPWGVKVDGFARPGVSDENTLISCIEEDEYQVARLPTKGVAIDLGSHIGASMLEIATRGLFVYGVEPLSENVKMINLNLTVNNYKYKLYKKAIAAEDNKEIPIYSDPLPERKVIHKYIGTTIKKGKLEHRNMMENGLEVKVQTISLPTIFKENEIDRCDFMKVDCEGAEWEVFSSLPEEYLDKIARIAIEIHAIGNEPTSTEEFMKLLKGRFFNKSEEYFPNWCAPGEYTHGYFINKSL